MADLLTCGNKQEMKFRPAIIAKRKGASGKINLKNMHINSILNYTGETFPFMGKTTASDEKATGGS